MDGFILTILTPEGEVFEGRCTSLIAPGTAGYFEILPEHAHFVSTLTTGALIVKSNENTQYYGIDAGAAEIINNDVRLLVEHCTETNSEEEAKTMAKSLAAGAE